MDKLAPRSFENTHGVLMILTGTCALLILSLCFCLSVRAQSDDLPQQSKIDHRKLIQNWSKERGRKKYQSACVACHGPDGTGEVNPQARSFTDGQFKNGADPYSLFRTLTDGYKKMPSMSWLTPSERYDVIRYIRQEFIKNENPDQFVPVTKDYLAKLPDVKKQENDERNRTTSEGGRDFGPGLSYRYQGHRSALMVNLGADNTGLSYDLHRMRIVDAWTGGGFLKFGGTLFKDQKWGNSPRRAGQPLHGLDVWKWALNGSFNVGPGDSEKWPKREPAPKDWMTFHGRYRHGARTVLSYRIGNRDVLEVPAAELVGGTPFVSHTLEIAPGEEPMKLMVGGAENSSGMSRGIYTYDRELADRSEGSATNRLAVVSGAWGDGEKQGDHPFHNSVLASVIGDVDGMNWTINDNDRIILRIPPSEKRCLVRVLRYTASGQEDLREFVSFARSETQNGIEQNPSRLTNGGPRMWDETITVEGKKGDPRNGYALDTVPVPFDNPYNTWMRTSALAFFPDGRAVVTTLTGDVWIVSGLDEKLDEVTWKRYAAGLYEPLGVQVIDGDVYVTCRDGIVRLRDLNGDQEADAYKTFYADPNVRLHWHMFNFDLQVDPSGNFYYSKTGLFNDYVPPPGAVRRVSPDGSNGEIFVTGFRVPNGMGMLPDGRPLVSDNEGGWIPASKISIVEKGAFYGFPLGSPPAGPDGDYEDPGKTKEPLVWIPQKLDPSSGAQAWVENGFGPLSNRLFHTSFGVGKMTYVIKQESEAGVEAAMITGFPHKFASGIHRVRQNPATGQVWATGLTGWQGPADAKDGCLQRLRYAGDARVIEDFHVSKDGIHLTFSFPMEKSSERNLQNVQLSQWNYKKTQKYGSPHYSVENPGKKGEDPVPISLVKVRSNQRVLDISTETAIRPVDQLQLKLDLVDQQGQSFTKTIFLTIHNVPE